MELFDNIKESFNRSVDLSEVGTKKTAQLGLFNASTSLDVPINVDARTSNTTSTYSPTYTDSRQISIITASPNASITSKKEDKISGSTNPNTQTGSTVPIDFRIPEFKLPSVGNTLLIGGAIVGAVMILKPKRGNK